MSDRPILFSAPMMLALMEGRKTQTRRELQGHWQAALQGHDRVKTWFAPIAVPKEGIANQWAQSGIWAEKHGPRGYNRFLGYTAYRPGAHLWVREAWRTEARYDQLPPSKLPRSAPIYYAADPGPRDSEPGYAGRLRASIHMPRWASRVTLAVTDVRAQRLQDISEEDAIAEGLRLHQSWGGASWYTFDGADPKKCGYRAVTAYAHLWEQINGADSWQANPWVAVYTFTVERRNIDAKAER